MLQSPSLACCVADSKLFYSSVNVVSKSVSHTAGCGVPDTTPAPEIMYKHAHCPGGQKKGLKATHKKQEPKRTAFLRVNDSEAVFRIWIRVDQLSFYLLDPDPHLDLDPDLIA